MADYFSPTVIQQTIPNADMSPLERLLLTHIFSAEPNSDGLYFYTEEGPADLIAIDRAELDAALATSRTVAGTAVACISEQFSQRHSDTAEVELDLSGTSWEFIVQDIVRRSPTLRYVTALSSFTCSKMRPDAFGGMAVLITPDKIFGKSTTDILAEFFVGAGIHP